MATVNQIVERTGLAVTTVAEILRGKPGYRAATRERVLRAARELNYRPGYLGKALAGGKSMTIGVLVGSLDPRTAVLRLRGIEAAARRHDYRAFVVGWGADSQKLLGRALEDLIDRRVDGLIFHHVGRPSGAVCKQLGDAAVPVVYLDWAARGAQCAVHIDRTQAIRELVRHLASLRHRRTAFIHTRFEQEYPHRKLRPLERACAEAGIDLDTSPGWMIPDGTEHEHGAYEIVEARFAEGVLPTAILANNDHRALGAMAAVADLGLHVPGDVSVAGFDDVPSARDFRPALTTIRQAGTEAGDAAFAMLHRLMQEPAASEAMRPLSFPCRLMVRDSTGPAKESPGRRSKSPETQATTLAETV